MTSKTIQAMRCKDRFDIEKEAVEEAGNLSPFLFPNFRKRGGNVRGSGKQVQKPIEEVPD